MTLKNSHIVSVTKEFADSFMKENEILQNVGLGVWHYGLVFRNRVIGVVSYGTTCFASNRGSLSVVAKECDCRIIQLCRGGCRIRAPKNSGSRMISQSLKHVHSELGQSIVVAYSDTRLGEIGTIYQAANAIYTGKTDPKGQANYRIHGDVVSGWLVRKRYGTRDRIKLAEIDPNVEVMLLKPKHRYIFTAGHRDIRRKVRRRLSGQSDAYPKRHIERVKRMKIRRTRCSVEFRT